MRFTVTTWNINSVRLRIGQVRRFLRKVQPDVLCLQETKCPEDLFPLKHLRSVGYRSVVHCGQKGYNGVAILSRHSFSAEHGMELCERRDARHIAITLGNTEQTLRGLGGDDTLDGGYDVNGLGSIVDVIDGGDGYDYTDYSKHPSSGVFGGGVFVDLGAGQQYAINTGVALGGLSDQLISIEGVIGTAFDDRFFINASISSSSRGALALMRSSPLSVMT